MNFASRTDWLAGLNTRELVILLLELQRVSLEQPQLSGEVDDACVALRDELLRRERPVHAA